MHQGHTTQRTDNIHHTSRTNHTSSHNHCSVTTMKKEHIHFHYLLTTAQTSCTNQKESMYVTLQDAKIVTSIQHEMSTQCAITDRDNSDCDRDNSSECKRKEERESVEMMAELVEGERGEEGEEREAVEVTEEEELSIKIGKPERGGDLEPHCEQWYFPTLLPPACKQGYFSLSATISPRPHTIQAFPSNISALVEQQTPNILPHSNPVSSTPLSSVPLFVSIHKKSDELVTGVNIPFCLYRRKARV